MQTPHQKRLSEELVEEEESEEELAEELLASDSDCAVEEIDDNDNTSGNIKSGMFVLVKYITEKKLNKFYVRKIIVMKNKSYEVIL